MALVIGGSAKVCRIENGGARRVELDYETVQLTTQSTLNATHCQQIGRIRLSRNVRIAAGVDCDRVPLIRCAGPAKVAGIDQNRIDDQRFCGIVRNDLETHAALALEDVVTFNGNSLFAVVLINQRLFLKDLAARGLEDELPFSINPYSPNAVEVELNDVRPCPWRNDEVILELLLIAVVDEVNPRINPGVSDAPISWNVPMP